MVPRLLDCDHNLRESVVVNMIVVGGHGGC